MHAHKLMHILLCACAACICAGSRSLLPTEASTSGGEPLCLLIIYKKATWSYWTLCTP